MRHKALVNRLAIDLVAASLVWLAVLVALEAILPGFVSRFFNLVWLVLIALAATMTAFITQE